MKFDYISKSICIIFIVLSLIFIYDNKQQSSETINTDISNSNVSIESKNLKEDIEYIQSNINIPVITYEDKDIQDKINKDIQDDVNIYYEEVKKQAKNLHDALQITNIKFISEVDYEVKKNEGNLLSMIITKYTYSGGAHGFTENIPYNYDLRDGKNVKLNDLFEDEIDYIQILNDEINRQINEEIKKNPEYKDMIYFKTIDKSQPFYIKDNNLTLYFGLYEIAPDVAGIIELEINEDVIEHELKEEYKEFFK